MQVGIIGFGSMGSMLLHKFAASPAVPRENIYVSNRSKDKLDIVRKRYPSVNVCTTNKEVVQNADIIFVCTRPMEIKEVLDEVKFDLNGNKHVISINGSLSLEAIESVCGGRISKIMPSVTAEINESLTLVCHNRSVMEEDRQRLMRLLEVFGEVYEIPEEEFGIGAELTSCMPGFLASMFEIMEKEARKHTQLPTDTVRRMLVKTVYATARLLLEKEIGFSETVARVATKGGITEEGVKVLNNHFPAVCEELFSETLQKREITVDTLIKQFRE